MYLLCIKKGGIDTTDLMLIAISVAVSLFADLSVNYNLFMKHGIGSKEYKDSLRFAKNNREIVGQQDIINNMNNKISQLETKVNSVSRNSNNYDLDNVKSEVYKIKAKLNNYKSPENNDNEVIVSALKELTTRVIKLEKSFADVSIAKENIGIPRDSSEKDEMILKLISEVNELKTKVETSEELSKKIIRQLSEEIINLKNTVSLQQKTIELLQNNKSFADTHYVPEKKSVLPKTEVPIQQKIVIPNESYVRKLSDNLMNLRDCLGSWEFNNCRKELEKLLNEGDFDDGEEIINFVHELIKKYIYGSDTKVSASQWEKLEKYIEDAGYIPVSVKAGDDIKLYKSYFDRPIQANGGIPNTIKQIQLKPFILTYEDCGKKETVKLCGKCTYYK